jgi:hypothetical protein
MTETGLMAWALPRAFNIHRRTEELLPWLTTAAKPWGSAEVQSVPFEKITQLIGRGAHEPTRCRAAVLLDTPNGFAHTINPLDRSEALLRMLADNLRIAPDGMDDADTNLFDCLAHLVKHTTVLRLSVGPTLDTLASLLTASVEDPQKDQARAMS